MVTRKLLEQKGFDQIEELFDDIIEKKVFGDSDDAKELFNTLSDAQKERFYDYLDVLYFFDQDENNELITMLNFFDYDRL